MLKGSCLDEEKSRKEEKEGRLLSMDLLTETKNKIGDKKWEKLMKTYKKGEENE